MSRLLIQNGHVVSLDTEIGTLPDADVLMVDGEIVAVGRGLPADDAEIIDASGTVVIPGFVDTHRHLWQSALRGLLPSCSLGEYFGVVMGTYAPAFRAQDVYAGNLVGAYEALNAGVTTIVDWCHCTNTPEHADAAIRALQETGIRGVYAYGWPGGFEWLMNSTLSHPSDARRVRTQYFASDQQLLTFALALRGPATLSAEVNAQDFMLARELNAPVTVHVGMRITGHLSNEIQILHDSGLLHPGTTYVHCNETPEQHLDLIAESGGSVSISPYVEMLMGHGHPSTPRLLSRGLRPGLSVDTATSVPGDMFTQMRSALSHGRISEFPQEIDVPFGPALTAMDVLRFATIDGAKACHLEERVGSLSPGKRGDVVLVRADQINTLPATDPVATVVTCADTSNIDTVIVDGRVVKRSGRLLGPDLKRLYALAVDARDHVINTVATGAAR
jgi:5-methylthioadenosine/S-adenosylhomocysteine deaminase